IPSAESRETTKKKREGGRELFEGELTAEYGPDVEEKAPSVHGFCPGPTQRVGGPRGLQLWMRVERKTKRDTG
ncbi:hypothetical protein KUCAC02_018346, partial [Chaenocephalus aceratus]